ncbi:MAG: hypothetical protein ACYCPQ_07325 [Elusimicrobiota bacterium]
MAASAAACRSRGFSLSGTVTVAAPLLARAQRPNSVLFIIVENWGGVPVAVRRVVNPAFPVFFHLTARDLVIPGSPPQGPFKILIEINPRGDVGRPKPGDLEGRRFDPVKAGSRHADVVVNLAVATSGRIF